MPTGHLDSTQKRAMELYFKIEQHFAAGGEALLLREVRDMLGLKSNSTTRIYLQMLEDWGLVTLHPGLVRSIVLNNKGYPPVVYVTPTNHTEPLKFPRR